MIKNKIKESMNSNKYSKKLLSVATDFKGTTLVKERGNKKIYPKVLQMPITTKCNSRCVMCNIPNMNKDGEMNVGEYAKALQDPIFKDIEAIGINGGEPFLLNDLEDYVKATIDNLPSLKSINIISNGFLTNRILEKTEKIYSLCKNAGKGFDIIVSLDGYGEVHDIVRGIPGAFVKVENTIEKLYADINKYADRMELACTVMNQNVDNLIELDTYCKLKGYNIKYRLGIENERIDNKLLLEGFSVLNNKKSRQTAAEFFHYKYQETKEFKYYSIFKYLSYNQRRIMGCHWRENGITMDPKGNVYYCAVESKKIGNIKKDKGQEIFFSKENLNYREEIISNKCDKCIHDYSGKIATNDMFNFYKERLNERRAISRYKRGV